MSGVALRCPNCGTTRGTPGECEACHEAEVRYYCTNHTPGRWLDAASCSQCGAVFGVTARPPAAAPPRSGPPVAPPSRRPYISPAPATIRRPPPPPPRSGRAGDSGDRPYPPGVERDPGPADPEADRRVPRWQELLLAAARAGAARRDAARYVDPAPPRRGRGGCLLRVVLFAVIAFIALSAAPSLLGSLLLRMLGGY